MHSNTDKNGLNRLPMTGPVHKQLTDAKGMETDRLFTIEMHFVIYFTCLKKIVKNFTVVFIDTIWKLYF